jgi:hypothetical protein
MKHIKTLQLLILGLFIISCQKQNEYHIIGKLQNIPDSTIIDLFVQYENVGSRIASDTITNVINDERQETILWILRPLGRQI